LVRVTVSHGPWDGLVRSTGPHGTGLHGPVLSEWRIGRLLNRTVVEHEADTDLTMVQSDPVHNHRSIRNELDRTIYLKTLNPTSGLVVNSAIF
jgi:hypothetical protein